MKNKKSRKPEEIHLNVSNIFNDLGIKNQTSLSQAQLDMLLKQFIEKNRGKSDQPDWLKGLTFPLNEDGSPSYGQLNRDGSISLGVLKSDGSMQSMDDYYKQYPWNKPGLSKEEHDQLFNEHLKQKQPQINLQPLPSIQYESPTQSSLPSKEEDETSEQSPTP